MLSAAGSAPTNDFVLTRKLHDARRLAAVPGRRPTSTRPRASASPAAPARTPCRPGPAPGSTSTAGPPSPSSCGPAWRLGHGRAERVRRSPGPLRREAPNFGTSNFETRTKTPNPPRFEIRGFEDSSFAEPPWPTRHKSDIEAVFGPDNVAAWTLYESSAPTGPADAGRVADRPGVRRRRGGRVLRRRAVRGAADRVGGGRPVVAYWRTGPAVLAGCYLYGSRAGVSYVDYAGNRFLALKAAVYADMQLYKAGIKRLDATARPGRTRRGRRRCEGEIRLSKPRISKRRPAGLPPLFRFEIRGFETRAFIHMNVEHLSNRPPCPKTRPTPAVTASETWNRSKASLRRFGQQKPIIIDAANVVRGRQRHAGRGPGAGVGDDRRRPVGAGRGRT